MPTLLCLLVLAILSPGSDSLVVGYCSSFERGEPELQRNIQLVTNGNV